MAGGRGSIMYECYSWCAEDFVRRVELARDREQAVERARGAAAYAEWLARQWRIEAARSTLREMGGS